MNRTPLLGRRHSQTRQALACLTLGWLFAACCAAAPRPTKFPESLTLLNREGVSRAPAAAIKPTCLGSPANDRASMTCWAVNALEPLLYRPITIYIQPSDRTGSKRSNLQLTFTSYMYLDTAKNVVREAGQKSKLPSKKPSDDEYEHLVLLQSVSNYYGREKSIIVYIPLSDLTAAHFSVAPLLNGELDSPPGLHDFVPPQLHDFAQFDRVEVPAVYIADMRGLVTPQTLSGPDGRTVLDSPTYSVSAVAVPFIVDQLWNPQIAQMISKLGAASNPIQYNAAQQDKERCEDGVKSIVAASASASTPAPEEAASTDEQQKRQKSDPLGISVETKAPFTSLY